jgi:hypothetical protein
VNRNEATYFTIYVVAMAMIGYGANEMKGLLTMVGVGALFWLLGKVMIR